MTKTEEIKELEARIKELKESIITDSKEELASALAKTGYNWVRIDTDTYDLELKFNHPLFPEVKEVTFRVGYDSEFSNFYLGIIDTEEFDLELEEVYTIDELISQFTTFQLKYYTAPVKLVSPYYKEEISDYKYEEEYSIIGGGVKMEEVREPILQYCTPIKKKR